MFTINTISINCSEDLAQLPNETTEELNIIHFLEEWYNSSSQITVSTSGSTGTPKLIQLSKNSVLKSAELTCSYFGLKKEDTALLCLPTNFIAGKLMLIRALFAEINLISVPPSSNPLKAIASPIRFAAMTPMQVNTILRENPEKLNLIATLIIGGAPVDKRLENKLKAYKTNCYATFGMTETITHIALRQLNHHQYYTALASINFEQTSDGCLIINAPHLSQQQLITNDKVELLSNTEFIWQGRKDNVINSGGIKIQAEVLEQQIARLIPNNRIFIATEPDELLGNKIILIIEAEHEFSIRFEELNKYEVPKTTYWVKQFEETETGKINRSATLAKIFNTP